MKKTASIVILLLFLTHLIGFYVYFVVRQTQIRQEMRESIGTLPVDQFEVFVFTAEEYKQIKVNDHEVRINGRMYDHSTPKIENGKVVLYAQHDEAEDNLISLLSKVINNTTQDNKPVPSQLLSFLSLAFVPQSPLTIFPSLSSESFFDAYPTDLINQYYSIESPPPKV